MHSHMADIALTGYPSLGPKTKEMSVIGSTLQPINNITVDDRIPGQQS